jgi:TRAP transporter TAXI family solute receptor
MCALLCILLLLTGVSASFAAEQLRFATASAGGLWYILGGAMSELFAKVGMQASVTSGNTIPNIVNTEAGKADLALSVLFPGMLANTDGLKEKAFENVALIGNMYPQYLYVAARKDYAEKNGLNSVGDLFEKKLPFRFATLARGSVTDYLARQVFDVYDFSVEKLLEIGGKVEYGSYEQGADLMVDNHVDLYIVSSGLPLSSILNIETKIDIRILPMDEKTIKSLQDRYGAQMYTIPKGSYKSVTEDVLALGAWTSLLCRKDMPEEQVYTITKLIFDNKDTLVQAVSAMSSLSLEMASMRMEFPIHPGAQRFYDSQKK